MIKNPLQNILSLFFLLLFSTVGAQTAKPTLSATKSNIPLKAVLVVGGSNGQTQNSMQSTNKIAAFLKEKGVETFCFYDTAALWQDIKKSAAGAHIFIYNGHGLKGGGLSIEAGGSTQDISKLLLAKNALVAFQSVCFGAGSSASDDEEISRVC